MRRIASFATVFSAFCVAAVLAGCGSPAAAPATSAPPAATSTAPATAPATATASPGTATKPAVTAPAGWRTFTTSDGSLAFDYPESWTIRDPAGQPAEGGAFVELVSDYGKTMATLRTNIVTAGECTRKLPFVIYDSEPVTALAQDGVAPRFVFEGRTDPASGYPSMSPVLPYGLTSAPEPAGDAACPISHYFTWPPSGAAFSGLYDPFDTTPGGPMHVDTPEVYMDTTEYKYVKQAITSLRPAGKS